MEKIRLRFLRRITAFSSTMIGQHVVKGSTITLTVSNMFHLQPPNCHFAMSKQRMQRHDLWFGTGSFLQVTTHGQTKSSVTLCEDKRMEAPNRTPSCRKQRFGHCRVDVRQHVIVAQHNSPQRMFVHRTFSGAKLLVFARSDKSSNYVYLDQAEQ